MTEKVPGAAIEVHRALGPGLLESACEECPCFEFGERCIRFKRQVPLPVTFKKVSPDCGYRMDLLVEDALVVELKTVEKLLPVHEAQLLTYLKLSGMRTGAPGHQEDEATDGNSLCLCASVVKTCS